MDDPIKEIEFEALLLGRHLSPVRRDNTGRKRLDRSAYTLLARLIDQGPMSIGELSEAFGLDASTLNRQTAAMMREDLVERIPDPDGGVARKFLVTAHGRSRLNADRRYYVAGLRKVIAHWPDEDLAAFAALLRRFNSNVEARTGQLWPRP